MEIPPQVRYELSKHLETRVRRVLGALNAGESRKRRIPSG